jgi:predicted ATPase
VIRTVANVMQRYGCDAERAQRYIDLRDEGYSQHQALLMAGLADPPEFDVGTRAAHSEPTGRQA